MGDRKMVSKERADQTGRGDRGGEVPVKDGRQEPPAQEGKGIDNDRYSKSDSDQPQVKKSDRASK